MFGDSSCGFGDSNGMGSHGMSEGEWAGRCAESRGTEGHGCAWTGKADLLEKLSSTSLNQHEWVCV